MSLSTVEEIVCAHSRSEFYSGGISRLRQFSQHVEDNTGNPHVVVTTTETSVIFTDALTKKVVVLEVPATEGEIALAYEELKKSVLEGDKLSPSRTPLADRYRELHGPGPGAAFLFVMEDMARMDDVVAGGTSNDAESSEES